jgi:MFS family permease
VNLANAMVQMQVADHLRGRVMSIYTLVFFGGMPIGSLIAGTLANRLGEPAALMINATILLVFSGAIYLFLPFVRRQD